MSDFEERQAIRDAVRRICSGFPDTYWREIDRNEEYPHAFVKALTESGYLAALIPEEYGGAGLGMTEASIILEEINRSGRQLRSPATPRCTPWARCCKHGSDEQKRRYLPAIATRRAAPAGLRRHRAERRLGDDAHRNHAPCARATATSSTGRRSSSRA